MHFFCLFQSYHVVKFIDVLCLEDERIIPDKQGFPICFHTFPPGCKGDANVNALEGNSCENLVIRNCHYLKSFADFLNVYVVVLVNLEM